MLRYHDERLRTHAKEAAERDDKSLLDYINQYSKHPTRMSFRSFLKTQDHRSWRRAVIREALSRGLIDEDPGDAP